MILWGHYNILTRFIPQVSKSNFSEWIIIFIMAFAAFISAFDMSVVNIILPIISKSMNVSVGDISLSVTVYLLVLSGLILSWDESVI